MKINPLLIVAFFIFLLNSCGKEKVSFLNKVNKNDTICLKEVNKANEDLIKGKLVYCHYVGNIIWNDLRAENEMKNLLMKYNIEFQNESSPCVIDPKINYHCYCELMQEKINEKHGKKFIESLLWKSDSLWVLKNLDKTFGTDEVYGSWDKCSLFPGDKFYNETNHSGLQDVFDKQINYPQNYKFKSHEYSNATIDATVLVYRNGNAKVIEINTNFYDFKTKKYDYNKNVKTSFEKVAKEIIEKNKWTPAKIKGINVNSKNNLWIYLK